MGARTDMGYWLLNTQQKRHTAPPINPVASKPKEPPPDPQQVLPDGPNTALLASIRSRYRELAQSLGEISDETLRASLAQNHLAQNAFYLTRLPEKAPLRHPPQRNIHVFSLRRLPLSLLVSAKDSKTIHLAFALLPIDMLDVDIRQLTEKQFRPCAQRLGSPQHKNSEFLLKTLSNLLVVIAVTGACLDMLSNPRPDNMEPHTLNRDAPRPRRPPPSSQAGIAHPDFLRRPTSCALGSP